MTGEEEPKPRADPDAEGAPVDEADDAAIRALLKRSFDAGAVEPAPKGLLPGVQKRIRTRSRGKFYGDGWSTSTSRVSYVLVAVAMLVVIGVADRKSTRLNSSHI